MSDAPSTSAVTAEQIVRALAASDPYAHAAGEWHSCGLCEKALATTVAEHDLGCPWRLAMEWVGDEDAVAALAAGLSVAEATAALRRSMPSLSAAEATAMLRRSARPPCAG